MFALTGLFRSTPCPDKPSCARPNCLFSHAPDLPPSKLVLDVPAPVSRPPITQPVAGPSSTKPTIPAKRPTALVQGTSSVRHVVTAEPPRKLQKIGGPQRPTAVASLPASTETGVPVIRARAAESLVAIPVRQTMLKTLYEHFRELYKGVLATSPSLATEHALKQEEEVYKRSTKLTYRNAVIQCIAAIKRRPPPTSPGHPSIGTEDQIAARVQAQKELEALKLDPKALESLVHTVDELKKWGYFVEIPPGPGGDQPTLEGQSAKCERCGEPFMVKRMEEAEKCDYHWGKPVTTRASGERIRVYTCCARLVTDAGGCIKGPHVFYESAAETLHARQPFSFLSKEKGPRSVDIAALDCEMIYSTGGMRVARVSVVDGSGDPIFDEFVRMDDDVHVIDFNTRFSGINAENYAKATRPLATIRQALDEYLHADTILIGHALDNDLKTLRIIHHRCIDTALLFPHKAGPPYRRALRDLVREKLGRFIQMGDSTVGHSSLEDASATLDVVRWYVLNEHKSS